MNLAPTSSAGRLTGVVTDGDLRRLLLRGEAVGTQRAHEVGTRAPKTIAAGALAAEALVVMETSGPITSLVVVIDEMRRPVGVIHMHHVLRAKAV